MIAWSKSIKTGTSSPITLYKFCCIQTHRYYFSRVGCGGEGGGDGWATTHDHFNLRVGFRIQMYLCKWQNWRFVNGYPSYYVFNTKLSEHPVEHWEAVYIDGSFLFYKLFQTLWFVSSTSKLHLLITLTHLWIAAFEIDD